MFKNEMWQTVLDAKQLKIFNNKLKIFKDK